MYFQPGKENLSLYFFANVWLTCGFDLQLNI